MSKLPKHTKVNLNTIYGEELVATIIPLSIKATMDVEAFVEGLKTKLMTDKDIKKNTFRKSLESETPDNDELFGHYVESKITMDLSKLGEEITEERVKSLTAKRKTKLLEGKTREMILEELSDIAVELDVRKQILSHTVSRTLWNVLRKQDNLREHLFIDIDELEDSLDQDTLIDIFNQNVDESKVEDEDLKN